MLRIVLKNGNVREYKGNQFTDYEWKKKVFVVINGDQWIAMFNWSEVCEVLYLDDPDDEIDYNDFITKESE